MSVVDEVLYFFTVFLLILGFVLVVDLGFDIEQACRAGVSSAFAAVALFSLLAVSCSRKR
jgi:threonine/homoserine efflux transporter RhtA